MPEPLQFKIITDADDSGIRKYDNSLGNLNVSSRKASAALNSFSRDLMQAKSGADVASAGAESLAHMLHQGLAGALIIGGVKLVSDQIKSMGEMIRGVGEETAGAVRQLEKMGQPGNLSEAVKGADMLDQKLESVTKRLEAIKGGNFFTRMLGDLTGVTGELEQAQKTTQLMIDSQLALGFATEKQNAARMAGATDEQKSIEAINQKYEERVKIAERITDQNAKAQAMEDIQAIRSAEAYDLRLKLVKKLEDGQKKAADAEEKVVKAREQNVIRTGQIAGLVGATGGSARGPGQRKTSFEVGMERQAEQAKTRQARIEGENKMYEIAKQMGKTNERGQITDRNAVQNALIRQRIAGAQEEVAQKYVNDSAKALADATIQQKAVTKENQNTEKALSQFGGGLSKTDQTIKDLNETILEGKDNMELFNKATKAGAGGVAEGGGKAGDLSSITTSLDAIYDLLDGVLMELKDYAHAA